MTDRRLHELRKRVRRGELPEDLVAELRSVVGKLVRLRLLPPVFAPYGQWNEEAADEIFSSWYTDRLLGRGSQGGVGLDVTGLLADERWHAR